MHVDRDRGLHNYVQYSNRKLEVIRQKQGLSIYCIPFLIILEDVVYYNNI